jgi:hypothetical protein
VAFKWDGAVMDIVLNIILFILFFALSGLAYNFSVSKK